MPTPDDIREDCPLPDVADALRPYIKTRQEVAATRQRLQATLPLSSISLGQSSPDIDPSSLIGVRKAYWRALEAHRKAQSRYESLKAELDQLVHRESSTGAPTSEDNDSLLVESYVPLIRQRENYRKLKVIEASLAKVDKVGLHTVGESLDNIAKREVGELPAPPSATSLPDREAGFNAEYDLTQLKKAVLSTKQLLNEHRKATSNITGTDRGEFNPHADLKALQKAHNELTIWMETQLGVISDTDGANEADGTAKANGETNGTASYGMMDIEDLYEQYLEARRRLLHTVANPPSPQLSSRPSSPVVRRGSETIEVDNRTSTSELVVPYLATLTSTKQREQALLQQGTYTRRQMASSEEQTQAVLTRLADESHLLPPELSRRTPRGKDWAKAAESATQATADYTNQRTKIGLAATDATAKAIDSIQKMPSAYDTLLK